MGGLLGTEDRSRLLALDGLRGVAILLVLVHHLRSVFIPLTGPSWGRGGFLGVDLFFVLSGFLITGLLLDELETRRTMRLWSFYRRRVMRLYPALVVFLAVHVVYAARTGVPFDNERREVQSILLYYKNWQFRLRSPEGVGHLWSLSVEEQFYLVWPLVLMASVLLIGTRRRHLGGLIALGVACVALYRAWRWHDGMHPILIYQRTDTRVDALLIGALAAVVAPAVQARIFSPTYRRALTVAAWLACAVTAWFVLYVRWFEPTLWVGGAVVVAVACAVIVLAVLPGSSWSAVRALRWAPLRALGVVSYGVYLWHLPAFIATRRQASGLPLGAQVVIALALTAGFTTASWFLVERPFLRWKARLDTRSRVAPVPAEAATGSGVQRVDDATHLTLPGPSGLRRGAGGLPEA